ncbi:MAG: hypothetical protein ACKESB_00850 [Candidatus Hodgkinia cicadicola]
MGKGKGGEGCAREGGGRREVRAAPFNNLTKAASTWPKPLSEEREPVRAILHSVSITWRLSSLARWSCQRRESNLELV